MRGARLARRLGLAGALAFLAFLPARAQLLDVLDIYHELQVAQPNGFPAYDVVERDGVLASTGPSLFGPEGRLYMRMDKGRLFLRIDDEGEGGEDFVTEIAVWLDPEGAPLLGLSERDERAGIPQGGRVRFYSRASSRWNLVTDQVLPSPEAAVCGTPKVPVDESTAGLKGLGTAVVLLPPTGTDLEVWCLAPGPDAGTGRMMTWERDSGRFHEGAVIAGPPPWPATLGSR